MANHGGKMRSAAVFAVVFGALTILSGVTTLVGAIEMGAVVPFVLWFNTFAGLLYIAAGAGLWHGRRWAFALALGIFVANLIVLAFLSLHIVLGGAFEMRTVYAMTFRCIAWGLIVLAARGFPAVRG